MSLRTFKPKSLAFDDLQDSRDRLGDSRSRWQVSPLDLPQSVQLKISDDHSLFEIAFVYISGESDRVIEQVGTSAIERGTRTGRIYAIRLGITDRAAFSDLPEKLQQVTQYLGGRSLVDRGGTERARIYRERVAKHTLDDNREEVLGFLGPKGDFPQDGSLGWWE